MKVQDRTPERLGPYHVIRRLGQGGMGVVYLAADAGGQEVAVKALHPQMAQDENARRRLAREVETMSRVRSQYVAEVLGADLEGDTPYIVTRYVPGLALDAVVSAGGPMTGAALRRLAFGLAKALGAVHSAGVVHRDLKPGNVMISDGEPVVIDFGIAQLAETTRLTMTGMFMGTPGYLAPEVIEGKDSGPASDVHSWGATVAYAGTGRPPYGTGTYEAIFFRIVHGQPDLQTLPPSLRPLVTRALARDPVHRPSAEELASWAVTLDPEALVPGPPGIEPADGGSPVHPPVPGFGPVASHTIADQAGWQDGPTSTRPMPSGSPAPAGNPGNPDDVRDLLPPVRYGSAAALFAPGSPGAAGLPPNGGAPGGNGAYGAGNGAYGAGNGAYGAGLANGAAGPGNTAAALGIAGAAFGGQTVTGGQPGLDPGAGQLAFRGQADLGHASARPFPEPNQRGQFGPPAGAAARPAGRDAAPISPWSPLVIASILIVVAVSVIAPIVGTGAALVLLILLRAGASTSRRLTRRAETGAGRAGAAFTSLVLFPLALLRALIGIVLLSPVALLGASVAAATTIIAVPDHPLPQALAFAAGTLIAIVGLGPGSSGSRQVLAGLYGSAARTPGLRAVAYVGVLSVCAWTMITAWNQAPAALYWPVTGLHAQLENLPTLHTLLTDIRQNLLSLAHHFSL
jgi:serine/threonine protein kinase